MLAAGLFRRSARGSMLSCHDCWNSPAERQKLSSVVHYRLGHACRAPETHRGMRVRLHTRSARRSALLCTVGWTTHVECQKLTGGLRARLHTRSARRSALLCTVGWTTHVERQELTGVWQLDFTREVPEGQFCCALAVGPRM